MATTCSHCQCPLVLATPAASGQLEPGGRGPGSPKPHMPQFYGRARAGADSEPKWGVGRIAVAAGVHRALTRWVLRSPLAEGP